LEQSGQKASLDLARYTYQILSAHPIGNVSLKKCIVMLPMCLYSAQEDGFVNPFHTLHHGVRAFGGVGLIIIEATRVESRGRISSSDFQPTSG